MQRQSKETCNLLAWHVMDFTCSADAAGEIFQYTRAGIDRVPVGTIAGANLSIGPFIDDGVLEVVLDSGEVTFVSHRYNVAALIADLAAHKASQPTQEFAGDGAPVDYTDGDPPATGEGVAEIGARYTDYTNGKLYLNGGTKAQPIWKLVTSAT